jgi:hypothetical protein
MGLTVALIVGSLVLSTAITIPVLRSVGVLGPRKRVLANGVAGEAKLVALTPTNTTVNDVNVVCRFQLRVDVPGRAQYDVQTKEPVPIHLMALLVPGSIVPVRVDQADPSLVFVDWPRGIRPAYPSPTA